MFDHGHFSSYEGHKERRTNKIRGAFSRMHRALDGWMLARAPASPAPPLPWTLVFQFALFLCDVVVVVVVFFTFTDRASTIPSNIRGCQSGTWSQRGTKVNGSHHDDNPLLRPTGIQIATKSYTTLQAMAPTNNKTVHQTSFTPYREQPRSMCGLEKLRIVNQNWLKRDLAGLLLRTLVVGRRQQSESIEAALDIWSKEV